MLVSPRRAGRFGATHTARLPGYERDYRHPAVLAKIAATVDQVSHGRLTLGIGSGWQENEHDAYGIPLGTAREQMDRFEEAVQILRSLLRQARTTFAGEYFQLRDAPAQPAPVQQPLPLLIGGDGERRMLRVVAQYADQWNAWTTPEQAMDQGQPEDPAGGRPGDRREPWRSDRDHRPLPGRRG